MSRLATCTLFVLLAMPIAAGAQSFHLSGGIVDSSGAVLPAVTVTATLTTAGQQTTSTVRTDAGGRYAFGDLRPGAYRLTASLPGFTTADTTVEVSSDIERDLTLRIGSLEETVRIVAGAPPREPMRAAAPRQASTSVPAPAPAAAGGVRVGGNLKAPRKIADVPPIYPAALAAAKVGGVVILEGTIDSDGRVSAVKVLRPAAAELASAASEALAQWEFTPTLLNGMPVPVTMIATFDFVAE